MPRPTGRNKHKGIEVDSSHRFSISGIENKPRTTDGQTKSPLVYEMVDTAGGSGQFNFSGQITDMGDSDDTHKLLWFT